MSKGMSKYQEAQPSPALVISHTAADQEIA